jgi:predicted small integral membrane protein
MIKGIREIKALMVAALACYPLIVAFGNITDYGSNFAFVQHVMSMDTTFPNNTNSRRSRLLRDLREWARAGLVGRPRAKRRLIPWVAISEVRYNKLSYRAITSPALQHSAYALIIAGEAATGIMLAYGALALWRARKASAAKFAAAKIPTALGGLLAFLVWFVGFLVIAGEWFAMWQSEHWNGQQSAFRCLASVLLVVLFVMQPEEERA